MKLKPWRRGTDEMALRPSPLRRELEGFLGNFWNRSKPFEMRLPEVFSAAKTPPVNTMWKRNSARSSARFHCRKEFSRTLIPWTRPMSRACSQ